LVLVTDSSFAAIEFLAALGRYDVTCITRLRLSRDSRLGQRIDCPLAV
jgi:hypothetical protein